MKRSALMVTIVPLLAIVYLVYQFARPPWTPIRLGGLLLTTPALILLTIARIQLGNSFSVAPQATQLVNRGIYSRIRNPIYVFGTIVFTGLFLFLERPLLLLLLVPVLILQVTRALAPRHASSNSISAISIANTEPAPGFDFPAACPLIRKTLGTELDSPFKPGNF
jgi:protein-S-isoprenylcysteine O-methyltransferase Ste14